MSSRLIPWTLGICFLYGMLSFMQTVNAKYMYKVVNFQFYSLSFALQRIIVIVIFLLAGKGQVSLNQLKTVAPFAILMCTMNLLSSFCIAVMPLAAFAAFKKITILFVLGVGIAMRAKQHFTSTQYSCMGAIGVGAVLVGIQDIADGEAIGYIACIVYNLSEAISLQYANYLGRTKGIQPLNLLYINALLSLPYYTVVMLYEQEMEGIVTYFQHIPPHFWPSFLLMLVLGCSSELVANCVTMKISPFDKAIISNIKDIFILFVSYYFFHDFSLNTDTVIGSILVFGGSIVYSLPSSRPFTTIRPRPFVLAAGKQESETSDSDQQGRLIRKLNDQVGNINNPSQNQIAIVDFIFESNPEQEDLSPFNS